MASTGNDGTPDSLPEIDSAEAPITAITRSRKLLERIENEQSKDVRDLKLMLAYATDVLEHAVKPPELRDDSLIPPGAGKSEQTQIWVNETYTRRRSTYSTGTTTSSRRKSDVTETTSRKQSLTTETALAMTRGSIQEIFTSHPRIKEYLDEKANIWTFNAFDLKDISFNCPLICLGYFVFQQHDFMSKFNISGVVLYRFLAEIEKLYKKVPESDYHNNVHATDVTQAMHSLLSETRLKDWLSDLELLACYLAAIVHDVDHNGQTNEFHIQTGSYLARLYNDRSVQENHHLATTFQVLTDKNADILANLEEPEYRTVRRLVIKFVLATDLKSHSRQLSTLNTTVEVVKPKDLKTLILSFCLHFCDISNPMRTKDVYDKFTKCLVEEFCKEGDIQKKLNLPVKNMGDRTTPNTRNSQLEFIDTIVQRSYEVLEKVLHRVVPLISIKTSSERRCEQEATASAMQPEEKPEYQTWLETVSDYLTQNRRMWSLRNVEFEFEKDSD